MSRKRPLAVLLAVLLLAAPGARGTSYEDLDEEVLAAQEKAAATPDPAATPGSAGTGIRCFGCG